MPQLVEIKTPQTESWYLGFVTDFDGALLTVRFENDWKPTESVDPSAVRSALGNWDHSAFHPAVGDDVEALTRASPDEPFGWWRACVRMVRQDFYLINYAGYEEKYNEIVELETLRPCNMSSPFKADQLICVRLPIPAELLNSMNTISFEQIETVTEVLSVSVQVATMSIAIIGTMDKVKKSKILVELQLNHEIEIQRLNERKWKVSQSLEEEKKRVESHVKLEFSVSPDLLGLVIGKGGKNIEAAMKMEGVESVRVFPEQSLVRVLAKTEEIALAVRAKMEYIEVAVPFPLRLIALIVGKKGKTIRDIQTKSEVYRIDIDAGDEKSNQSDSKLRKKNSSNVSIPGVGHVVITGISETVENAKLMLEHHLQYLEEYEKAELEAKELTANLAQLRSDYGLAGYRSEPHQGKKASAVEVVHSPAVQNPISAVSAPLVSVKKDRAARGDGKGKAKKM